MAEPLLSLSNGFAQASEADWLDAVAKALRGRGLERITGETQGGIAIRPLYRETDYASADGAGGMPGEAPYLRGAARGADRPWDIRQAFAHPDPGAMNGEILRDLERGVSSVELSVGDGAGLNTALSGVRADMACVALDHQGANTGAGTAARLAHWAGKQAQDEGQRLAFNLDILGALARGGAAAGELNAAFAGAAAQVPELAAQFPLATALRVDARMVHEAGGNQHQELGALMAHAVDTLRRLEAAGLARKAGAVQMLFTLSVDSNYGAGIAKLRSARRLWARVQEALGLEPAAMRLQAVTSARMLTRYDPWVNMLRGMAACFAGAVGGADVVTVRAFNSALGRPEELGRRVARNTQIIAMEESGLGRVADPAGGAWFSEALGEAMAQAAWAEFQRIESEGGYGASLLAGAFQARVAKAREALQRDVARRKVAITGVSEFALLDGVEAPVAEAGADADVDAHLVDTGGLAPMRLATPFEALRDRAEAHLAETGKRPGIFVAALGPASEHSARADFARRLFAAGGIEVVMADSFKASGCKIAVICGADARYADEAVDAAKALKAAGAVRVWIAGKFEGDGVDSRVFVGCDAVHELTLALAELGAA